MNGQCSIKAHKPIHRCYFNIMFSLYWSEKVDKKYGELCGTRRRPFKNAFTVEVKGDSDFSHICSKCKGGYKNSWKSDIKSTLSYIPHKKLKSHCVLFFGVVYTPCPEWWRIPKWSKTAQTGNSKTPRFSEPIKWQFPYHCFSALR